MGDAVLPELHRAIAHREVFAAGFGGGPAALRRDVSGFITWAHDYFQWEGLPYVVRVLGGPNDGDVVGTTTLGDLDVANESAHLGWTAYDPRVWGTIVNAETKLLVLGTAFDNGFGRVKIQADAINERSRAAILGIGATFEGVLRRDRPRADGTWLDSAVYSILADEWPAVRAGLQARLDSFAGKYVMYTSLRSGRGPQARSASKPGLATGTDAEHSAGAEASQ
jgi:RimJ/RimL family protein N-acetyltransferase